MYLYASLYVPLMDIGHQIQGLAGITGLVIVPGHQLEEVVCQLNTGLGVEDAGPLIAHEIGGNHIVRAISTAFTACRKLCGRPSTFKI